MATNGAETHYVTGAIFVVTKGQEGHYSVKQVATPESAPKPSKGSGSWKNLDYSYGPFEIKGQVDTDDYGITVTGKVLGHTIRSINGNIKDGLNISIDIEAAKGTVKLTLKNQKEVSIDLELTLAKILGGKQYQKDEKIFTI